MVVLPICSSMVDLETSSDIYRFHSILTFDWSFGALRMTRLTAVLLFLRREAFVVASLLALMLQCFGNVALLDTPPYDALKLRCYAITKETHHNISLQN